MVDALVVGDVYLHRTDPKSAFALVESEFADADIRIGNQEATLSDRGKGDSMTGPWLRSHPDMVPGLETAGFDVMTFANNHAMDYGPESFTHTLDLLDDLGVHVVGAGKTRTEAERPATYRIDGVDVGVLAFEATQKAPKLITQASDRRPGMNVVSVNPEYPEPHVNEFDVDKVKRQVREVDKTHDVVLVLMHWGLAQNHALTAPQRALATHAVEAGADAVIGSHPHVLQGIDVHRGAPIYYSLGHFVWDALVEPPDLLDRHPVLEVEVFSRNTAVAELAMDENGITSASIRPAYITETGQPELVAAGTKQFETIAGKLERLSTREGLALGRDGNRLRLPL